MFTGLGMAAFAGMVGAPLKGAKASLHDRLPSSQHRLDRLQHLHHGFFRFDDRQVQLFRNGVMFQICTS